MWTNERHNEYQRARRKATGNAATKKYEKTPKGFLMRLYRNMQSRISGVQKDKHHLYKGKELLSRQDFYDWALDHPEYKRLFSDWEKSGYSRRLTPS
jgi:phytoene dehydrogenase-like protein